MSIVRNWHKAVDGRGLNEETRSAYLADMKNWLLDDWMPWHTYMNDYLTIDINRCVYPKSFQVTILYYGTTVYFIQWKMSRDRLFPCALRLN